MELMVFKGTRDAGQATSEGDASVDDQPHPLVACAGPTKGGDHVGHGGSPRCAVPSRRGRNHVVVVDERLEGGFVDDMLRADLARGELAFSDPAPDRLWVLPDAA